MSMSPSSLLAKLDELKRWQQIQQERLLKQHNSRLEEVNKYPLRNSLGSSSTEEHSQFHTNTIDTLENASNKKQQVAETNQFNRQNDISVSPTNDMPKKPFLKRGTGLGKYGLNYGDHTKPFHKMKPPKIYKTALHKRITQVKSLDGINTSAKNETQEIPKTNENNYQSAGNFVNNIKESRSVPTTVITPLKPPEVCMLQKAKWCSVEETDYHQVNEPESHQQTDFHSKHVQNAETSMDDFDQDRVTPINPPIMNALLQSGNPELLQCLQKLAAAHFGGNLTLEHSDLLSKITLNETTMYQTPSNNNNVELIKYLQNLVKKYENNTPDGDLTTYEKAMEKELHVFEQLEQKVMNSSFSSTNSSVIELLASTPNKVIKVPTFESIQEHCNNANASRTQGTQHSYTEEESVDCSRNAKKMLIYPHDRDREEYETDESSVNSDDFERTMNETRAAHGNGKADGVLVRQNACTMTDPIENKNDVNDELLRHKLHELETEIASFRTENRKLEKAKGDLERERLEFQRTKKSLEKEYLDKREEMDCELEEERKKLQKEKTVFEKYTKDLQNKPNRKEREEILQLKEELANVKETLKLKETRSGTCQARLRNQIKAFEKENGHLKDELEKLQKLNAKLQAQHSTTNKKGNVETKMLHEINKNLTKLTKEQRVVKHITKLETALDEKEACEDSLILLENSKRKGKKKTLLHKKKKVKSSSDEDSSDESFKSTVSHVKPTKSTSKSKTNVDLSSDDDEEEDSSDEVRKFNKIKSGKNRQRDAKSDYQTEYRSSYTRPTPPRDEDAQDHVKSSRKSKPRSSLESKNNKENDKNSSNGDITTFRNLSDLSITENYEKVFGGTAQSAKRSTGNGNTKKLTRHNSLNDTQPTNKVETVLVDGSKETKYPNGNVKTNSADGNFTKMEYFNGDIKETQLLDGSIRYFYKDTQVWQTTYANGDETFEFPDGQVEKHFADGSSHVKFPNGISKDVQADGAEQINYPDGSVVNIKKNGEKVLLLPNGQKEIHTEAQKRREYPDGTVKIIYPDGLQETRYSNGRIRMKDKDGNLIMDSHKD